MVFIVVAYSVVLLHLSRPWDTTGSKILRLYLSSTTTTGRLVPRSKSNIKGSKTKVDLQPLSFSISLVYLFQVYMPWKNYICNVSSLVHVFLKSH